MLGKLLSTESVFGRACLKVRSRFELWRWEPDSEGDLEFKNLVSELTPKHTMVSLDRLQSLRSLVQNVDSRSIKGCVVECGTWRGGSLALMDWAFRQLGEQRELYACDSFEGLPEPSDKDSLSARSLFFKGWCSASEDDVRSAFRITGGDSDYLHFVKGWLEDSLPDADIPPIALLNVDVDWYDSVLAVLENLWDKVVAGGIVNFDDYGRWDGCDQAVHDFMDRANVSTFRLQKTARHGAWLIKP